MKIKIRKSVQDDVYGIRNVQKVTWLKTYPSEKEGITKGDIEQKFEVDKTPAGKNKIEEKRNRYKDRNTNAWVVTDEKKVIGFCTAVKEGKNNRIASIYILPIYQGKGLGKQLIEKALTWLGNSKDILLNVASYNKQAIGFYKKFGFIETGRVGAFDSAAKLPSGKFIPEIELIKDCSKK